MKFFIGRKCIFSALRLEFVYLPYQISVPAPNAIESISVIRTKGLLLFREKNRYVL
jgi:hypothetical protein